MMVDYCREREREERLREKFVNVSPSPGHHRERRNFFLIIIIIIIIIFRGVF
jgi:hypothetical protein